MGRERITVRLGYDRASSLMGSCICFEGKVCVPRAGIEPCFSETTGILVHDQFVHENGVEKTISTACLSTDDAKVWLPRCDAPHSCPSDDWICDKDNTYYDIHHKEIYLCHPR
jgi:hypothetical protein